MRERIVYQPEKHSPTEITMTQKGTLGEWKQGVVKLVSGNPYLVFSLCVAFTGPLLKPARSDSFGFHIYGGTTEGKTTSAQTAASVWGNGSDPAENADKAFTRRWNNSANAIEGICSAHNDGLLCLDELKTCPVKDFQTLVYNIFGGSGKGVMDQNRNLKDVRTWRIVVLSNGELSTRDKSKESGSPINAGQMIRLKDIPIKGHIVKDAKTAEAIKFACSQFYGTAGPAFVQALINDMKTWEGMYATVQTMLTSTKDSMPKATQKEQARGLKHFALVEVAGSLAAKYLELPITPEEISESVDFIASTWLANSADLSDIERAIIKLRNLVQTGGESRFRRLPGDDRPQIINQAGWWDLDERVIYINDATFTDEICAGLNYEHVAEALFQKQLLVKTGDRFKVELKARIKSYAEQDEATRKAIPIDRIKKVRAFAVRDSVMSYSLNDD